MRFLAIVSIVSVLAVTTSAQAPGAKPKPAPPPAPTQTAKPAAAPAGRPIGNLAQVMRGILFPNANILFDVQSKDPETFGKKEEGGGREFHLLGHLHRLAGRRERRHRAQRIGAAARGPGPAVPERQAGADRPEGLGAVCRGPAEGLGSDAEGGAVEEQGTGQRHDQRRGGRVRELPHGVSRRRPALHAEMTKGPGPFALCPLPC